MFKICFMIYVVYPAYLPTILKISQSCAPVVQRVFCIRI